MRERWLAAYVGVLGACFSPSAPIGLPCGEGFTCPSGQTCDILSNECGVTSSALVWRDDTAAEFGASGAYLDEVTVEKQGFIGPAAFLSGGVRVTGYEGLLVSNVPNTQFADIVANAPSGVGVQRALNIVYEDLNPPGLDLASGDDITLTLEGEIELEVSGSWRFRLTANDRGFFEIEDAPGSNTFTRVVNDVDTGTTQTFAAPSAGWYRWRGAFQDATNFLDYRLEYDPPNVPGNAFRDIPVDRMRVRAGDIEGLIVDGFENAYMLEHKTSLVSTTSLADLTLDAEPFGMPIGPGAFSLRWNGQFLIEQAGDYAFRLATAQGHRLWIDGVSLADEYADVPETSVTPPMPLEPGWHDIVLDTTKEGGPPTTFVRFTVESGPQFAGEAFPADHLRPISGRGARFVSDRNMSLLDIPNGPLAPPAPITRTLTVPFPATFSPLSVVAAVIVDHDLPSSVELVCDPPGGSVFTVAAFGSMSDLDTNHFFYLPMQVANAGTTWLFTATDNATDTNTGTISGVMVTMVYDGGVAPFPTTYRYVSAIRDLGEVVAFERFAWLLRQAPDPNAVQVGLRTCDTEDACASETFVDVVNGEAPTVPVRRFAQYDVRFTGNGDLPTAVDAVELRYFVRGER